jgi:hypothetical protein
MEAIFTEILKASPGLAVAVLLVVIFMKYIDKKDTLFQTLFNRVEDLHAKTLDTLMSITDKCNSKKEFPK